MQPPTYHWPNYKYKGWSHLIGRRTPHHYSYAHTHVLGGAVGLHPPLTALSQAAFSPGGVAGREHFLAGITGFMLMLFSIYDVTLVNCFSLLPPTHRL